MPRRREGSVHRIPFIYISLQELVQTHDIRKYLCIYSGHSDSYADRFDELDESGRSRAERQQSASHAVS